MRQKRYVRKTSASNTHRDEANEGVTARIHDSAYYCGACMALRQKADTFVLHLSPCRVRTALCGTTCPACRSQETPMWAHGLPRAYNAVFALPRPRISLCESLVLLEVCDLAGTADPVP